LSIYLVGEEAWRCFGRIIRTEVGVFHPCIAMPNLQGLRHSREEKSGLTGSTVSDQKALGQVIELVINARGASTAGRGHPASPLQFVHEYPLLRYVWKAKG
jgi:hypothetical protein